MRLLYIYIVFILFIGCSCSAIQETSKHQMEKGLYNISNQHNKKFYTLIEEDKITLHPAIKTKDGWLANTDSASAIYLRPDLANKEPVKFITRGFDLDVLTILFKYRPYTAGFPNQLNTNFNAAGYIGHRSDYYLLSYDKNPLNAYHRRISHFAYSLGFFGGIGATNMNPFVTSNQIQSEYDGVVITKGIVGLIGVGNLTFGAAIGFDHLMDKNHKLWIYQGRPWAGFTVGLNVN
jgi:hypothetical protein